MRRKYVPNAKNLVPTLDTRAPSHVCQHFPIPIATGEIEAHIGSDIKTVCQRKEGYAGRHTAAENEPIPTAARRPHHNCKGKQQRKCRRKDLSLEKNHQRSYCDSGRYPYAPPFARAEGDKYQRCSSARNAMETSRRNVLEPEVTVS